MAYKGWGCFVSVAYPATNILMFIWTVEANLSLEKAVSGMVVVERYGKATELQLMWTSNMTSKIFEWQKSGTIAEFFECCYLCTFLYFYFSVSHYLLSFYYLTLQLYNSVQCYSFSFPKFRLVFSPFRILSLNFIGEIRIKRYQYWYFIFLCRYNRYGKN